MSASLKIWSLSCSCLFLIIMFGCSSSPSGKDQNNQTEKKTDCVIVEATIIVVDTFPICSPIRLKMTKEYAIHNYKINDFKLLEPLMVVIHYTAIPTLRQTLNYFKSDSLDSSRKNIIKQSALNVGVHYVVDKDGSIYNLLPDSIMGRHLIGFNHIAIGIENVGKDSTDLTTMQIESNLRLVKHLTEKYPSIQYLIGHFEYDNINYPHYTHLMALDPDYMPYKKSDPGMVFMLELRNRLNVEYGLVLEK